MVRRVLASHAFASLGMSMVWPLLLVEVWERTHDEVLLGATGAARMLPYVWLSWAAGRLADIADRRRTVQATLVGRVAALAVAAIALQAHELRVAVVASAIAVAVATPAYPALAACLPVIAPRDHRRATELLVTLEVSSFVVGPALGGLMLGAATRTWLPWIAVAMAATALPLLPARLGARVPSRGSARRSVRSAWRRPLTRVVVIMALVNFLMAMVALALIPIAEGRWQGSAATYGVATGVLGFGALAGPLLGGGERSAASRVRLALSALGVSLAAIAPAPGPVWALPGLGLAGALAVAVEAAATGILQDSVPDEVRASVLGLTDTVMVAAALAGSLVGPLAVAWLGPYLVLAGAALTAVVVALPNLDSGDIRATETVALGVSKLPIPQ